jgi:hypothetical protein
MNHGGIGYIDREKIILPLDLLKPLSICEGTLIEGIFYPKSDSHPSYVPDLIDFVLAPVPFDYWNKVAALNIRLVHRPGALLKLSKILKEESISILNAECTRSAHRYASWFLTILFDKNHDQYDFDRSISLYKQTNVDLLNLKEKLLNNPELGDILFSDANDHLLKNSVMELPLTSMAYFHNFISNKERNNVFNINFPLSNRNGNLVDYTTQFRELINVLEDKYYDFTPSCVFAEMDTRDYNIRLAVIPKKKLKRFFEVKMQYERSYNKIDKTSKGLLFYIASMLPSNYNLWRIFNHTRRNDPKFEIGEIVIYLEDQSKDEKDSHQFLHDVENTFSSIETSIHESLHHVKIIDWRPIILNPATILERLTHEINQYSKYKYDLFIAHSHKDELLTKSIYEILKLKGIESYYAPTCVPSGDTFKRYFADKIQQSFEMIVVCTENIINNPWVNLEVGCAYGLGKKITPIIFDPKIEKKLPHILADFQNVKFFDNNELVLNHFIDQLNNRKAMANTY